MQSEKRQYLLALRYNWLTLLYDPICAITARERLFKSKLIKQASIVPGHKVLDVGCGTGTLALWLKQHEPQAIVKGLDGDQRILSIARRKAERLQSGVFFDRGLSFAMPYRDEQFDRCISSLFFHHLTDENKEKTFMEMFRVLRNDGEVHVADWGKPDNLIMQLLSYQTQLFDGFLTTDCNMKGRLPELMKSAGFHNVSIRENVHTVFGTMTLYRATKCL